MCSSNWISNTECALQLTGLSAKQLLVRLHHPITEHQRLQGYIDVHRSFIVDDEEHFLSTTCRLPEILIEAVHTNSGGKKMAISAKLRDHLKVDSFMNRYIEWSTNIHCLRAFFSFQTTLRAANPLRITRLIEKARQKSRDKRMQQRRYA